MYRMERKENHMAGKDNSQKENITISFYFIYYHAMQSTSIKSIKFFFSNRVRDEIKSSGKFTSCYPPPSILNTEFPHPNLLNNTGYNVSK